MKPGRLSAERLLPFAAFSGAALLLASQFMSIFELRSAGGVVQATVSSTDQHWLSMGLFAVLAAAAIFGAIWTGSRPLAFTVATCGVVALLLFLLIDLPDAGRTDSVATSAEALVIAEAHPAGGFWIELIGALILAVCGGAMATLSGEQLRALRPGATKKRPSASPASKAKSSSREKQSMRKRPSASSAPEAQSSSQRKPKSSRRSASADEDPKAKQEEKPKPSGRSAQADEKAQGSAEGENGSASAEERREARRLAREKRRAEREAKEA